jgi:hypothetical protein
MFIFDVLGGTINSPNLLSALDIGLGRGSEFIRIGFHRTNYGVHEPLSAAMLKLARGHFDFILTRNQFVNRLRVWVEKSLVHNLQSSYWMKIVGSVENWQFLKNFKSVSIYV